MEAVGIFVPLQTLQHIAEIHVKGLQVNIGGHKAGHALIVVHLIHVEQLLHVGRRDAEVIAVQPLVERRVEILHLEHIDGQRRITQRHAIAVHHRLRLHLGQTAVYAVNESLLLGRQFGLVIVNQRVPVVRLQIFVTGLFVPIGTLHLKEAVHLLLHKPHPMQGIDVVLHHSQLGIGHIGDVSGEVHLLGQRL